MMKINSKFNTKSKHLVNEVRYNYRRNKRLAD